MRLGLLALIGTLGCSLPSAAEITGSSAQGAFSPRAGTYELRKPKLVPAKALPAPDRVEVSIPYPNAGMYMYRGIYASFAGGQSRNDAESDPLFQWQGEAGYYYTPWFSGGVGFRINAGSPSDESQRVDNRYFLLTSFHKAWPRAAGYAGLRIGVDDVTFSLKSNDTLDLSDRLSEQHVGVGVGLGAGWKFSRLWGATLGQRLDASLVRQNAANPYRALNLMTQPGIALDLLRLNPQLENNVKAFYLLSEVQVGQSLSENGDWSQSFAWILGMSIAF
jgi:hypothetical protein